MAWVANEVMPRGPKKQSSTTITSYLSLLYKLATFFPPLIIYHMDSWGLVCDTKIFVHELNRVYRVYTEYRSPVSNRKAIAPTKRSSYVRCNCHVSTRK